MAPTTLPGLLDRLLARDAARPLLTFYDDATGERVELSVRSFDNWVAKTANLLQDGLGAEPGEEVALLLPTHWQGAVWVWAAAVCGLVIAEPGPATAVAVCGPDLADDVGGARDVVALSLASLGGRFPGPLPAGVLDYAAEVPGQPDVFVPVVAPGTHQPVVRENNVVWSHATLLERAREIAVGRELPAGNRLLTDANPVELSGLVSAVLPALLAGGSVVLVRHPDPAQTERRIGEERVTWQLGGTSLAP